MTPLKSENLWLDAQQEGLTLTTDHTHPTCTGSSVSSDEQQCEQPCLTFTEHT